MYLRFDRQLAVKLLILIGAAACVFPITSGGTALLLGILLGVTIGNPFITHTRHLTHKLLSFSVIGLGAGMNLLTVMEAGAKGFGYTLISIAVTLGLGLLFGRLLKTGKDTSLLITVGTAICGGSAIAAIAPVIRAKPHEISISLAVIFTLNTVALFLFPAIGHMLQLTETQFGLWSALAIHDTSSVVGAGLKYGPQALEIGTTVKLARALWIIPLVLAIPYIYKAEAAEMAPAESVKRKYPWFILGFLAMAAPVTFVPGLAEPGHIVEAVARRLLVLTLFLIGTNLTREALRQVGLRPLCQGIGLWIVIASGSLVAITLGIIG